MKKTRMSSAIATVLAATGLMTTATWASDREIYQKGGEGSVAVMLTLDLSRTMSSSFGTIDDGFSDYYGCTQSVRKKERLVTLLLRRITVITQMIFWTSMVSF